MKSTIAVLLLISLPTVLLADGVRCGSKLITVGSTSAEMAENCDKPESITRKVILGEPGVRAGVRYDSTGGEIQVEIWTFNFGPNQLMQRVTVQNGLVSQIESLGYGHN